MLRPRGRGSVSGPAHISLPNPGRQDSFRWPELTASAPNRPAVHRVLRLVIAVGTAATGVCLVIALTVLVVQLGATGVGRTAPRRPIAASQSGNSTVSRRGRPRPGPAGPATRWIAGPAIASFRGTGPARHDHFAVSSPGTWGLSWSFSCPAPRSGFFRLTAKGTTTGDDVELDVAGPTGRGITWNTRDAGAHSLEVSSHCTWTARVVLPTTAPGRRQAGREPASADARPAGLSRRSAGSSGSASARRSRASGGRAARRPTAFLPLRRVVSAS